MLGSWILVGVVALTGVQNDPAALYAQGVEQYNSGDYEQAVELLSRARALESSIPDYRYHLGLAYLKVGRPKEAARELEATLGMIGMRRETRLQEPRVLVQAAIAYLEMGNFKTARQKVELALEREPSDADAYYVLGQAMRGEGEEDEAIKAFEAGLELDRDHTEANLAMVPLLEARGEWELARENLRHASHGTTENFAILMSLGALAYRLGDVEEAEQSFAQALDERPGDRDARFNLGTIRLAKRDYPAAVETLRPLAVGEAPHDEASFNLALALLYSEDFAGARAVLERLLERDSAFTGASFSLGLACESMNDSAAAEAAYRDAIDARPDLIPAYLNLAALLEKLGREDEAIGLLESALEQPMDQEQARAIREAIARP